MGRGFTSVKAGMQTLNCILRPHATLTRITGVIESFERGDHTSKATEQKPATIGSSLVRESVMDIDAVSLSCNIMWVFHFAYYTPRR